MLGTVVPLEAGAQVPGTEGLPALDDADSLTHDHGDHSHDESLPKSYSEELRTYRTDELAQMVDDGNLSKEEYRAELLRRDPDYFTEDPLPPEFGLFTSVSLSTPIPLVGYPALARFTFSALEDVEQLTLQLINGTALVDVIDGELPVTDLPAGETIQVPLSLIPLGVADTVIEWQIQGIVRGQEITRNAYLTLHIDEDPLNSTFHQELSDIVEQKVESLVENGVPTQIPAAAYTGYRTQKISLLNGLDPFGEGNKDVNGEWQGVMTALQGWGWSGTMGGTAIYDCDENYSWNIEHHGRPSVSDIHAYELGSRSKAANHGGNSYCGTFLNPQPTTGSHDADAGLQHIAYHWAWTMRDHFGSSCFNAGGHSMGGLIMRYAAEKIDAGDPDFPSDLCIDDAITLGTPHDGSGDAPLCAWYYYQCEQQEAGSDFLTIRGLYPNPQAYGGTDWTAIGSTGDGTVSASSATNGNMDPAHAVVYEEDIAHSSIQTTGKHWKNSNSNDITANIRWTDEAIGSETTTLDGPWVGRYMDMSMAYDQWGCGIGSTTSAWPLSDGGVTVGQPFSSTFQCYYYIDVPSGQDVLDVTMSSLNGKDMDLVVRYGSPYNSDRCTSATTSSSEFCRVDNPSPGRWYILVYNFAATQDPFIIEADYEYIPDDLTSTLLTSYPSSVAAGASFSVCWRVYGTGSITHTDLHYGTTSSLGSTTADQTGTAPQTFCDTLTAPSSGTVYLKAHGVGPNDNLYSSLYSIPVAVADDLTSTSLTSYPSSVAAGSSYSVCWRNYGTGSITHTDLHYGTTSSLGSTTTDQTGTAPQTFCTSLIAPSSGTVYLKSHAVGPNDNLYSVLYTIPVASAQSDCGASGDAGDSQASARTITLPKSNCQGTLTSSDTQDWYKFYVTSGSLISASMTPPSGADFDLCLYTPSGSSVSCSTLGGSSTDSVSYTASTSGYWAVRVYQFTGTGTYSFSASTSSGSLTIRDDDGGRESYADIDYSDDTARKRLVLPGGATTGKSSATLYVYGQAVNCGSGGARWEMQANGYVVSTFDACSKWSSSGFGWASFSVPLSYLSSGITNTFYLNHLSGDWNANAVHVGIDTSTDYGRSDITQNGASMGGELMWYLYLS